MADLGSSVGARLHSTWRRSSVPMRVSIGILVTDFPAQSIQDVHGDYFHLFTQLLTSASTGEVVTQQFNMLEQQYPQVIDAFDAFLITGSSMRMYCLYC